MGGLGKGGRGAEIVIAGWYVRALCVVVWCLLRRGGIGMGRVGGNMRCLGMPWSGTRNLRVYIYTRKDSASLASWEENRSSFFFPCFYSQCVSPSPLDYVEICER